MAFFLNFEHATFQGALSAALAFIATKFLSPQIISPHHFQHIDDEGA